MFNKKLLILITIIAILIFSAIWLLSYYYVTYDEFYKIALQIKKEFNPKGFDILTKDQAHVYSDITVYPNPKWSSAKQRFNAYNNNAIQPKQITCYYRPQNIDGVISKITLVYYPYSFKKDYIIVDYYDHLKEGAVKPDYQDMLVTPYYQVGFSEKGYYIFVTSSFTEEYLKNKVIPNTEKKRAAEENANLVRQLQEFLITKLQK